MKKAFLLSLCILAWGIDSIACTLGAIPSTFCQAVKFNHDLIASGKILQKIDRGYLIEIEEVFRGEENRCQVKVFEQADWNCTGTLFDYEIEFMGEVGDIILFEARKIKFAQNEWDEVGEYRSPYVKIGAFDLRNVPLKKKGNKFNGPFSENQNSVRADRVMQSLDDCEVQNLLPQARQLCGEFPLNLYPNPAHERIFLEQAKESYTSIELFDLKGKLVHTQNSYEPSLGIPTTHLVSGLYLVVAKRGEATFRQKLLVSH